MQQTISFAVDDIDEPGARSFTLDTADGERECFIIRFAGEIRAYINSCPHTGISLNWSGDQFFDVYHKFVQCSLHGALFDPLNGYCVRGPCVGDSLKPLPLKLVDNQVLIYS